MQIIAATHNKGKMAEISELLKDFDIELVSWDEAGLGDLEIEEDGTTLEENSYIKAKAICDLKNKPALADDTGLFVEALNGEPGVYTARYAGEHCTEADNRIKMLKNLQGVPMEKRKAVFATVCTIVYPDGSKLVARGECPGYIAEEEKGSRGFGYDSIFIPDGHDKTFAELPLEYKNSLSHRQKALKKLTELLESK